VSAVLATQSVNAQTYSVLYSFKGGADGQYPFARLNRDAAGNLYGTTDLGGVPDRGTVFKLDSTGTETVLYTFSGADGGNPFAGMIRDAAGNLYGTTVTGGVSTCYGIPGGCGTVFKLNPTGTLTVLHSFDGSDGSGPFAGLVYDNEGNLYGTTAQGGDLTCDGGNTCGVVFKLDKKGVLTVLHTFTGGADGNNPSATLIRDAGGNLYGTAGLGGDLACGTLGCGTVFKLDPTGTLTVLHTFTGGSDGAGPNAGLIQDPMGNLYGTTGRGGADNAGTVFKIDPSGTETVVHTFDGRSGGGDPIAGLIQDAAGILYGTTFSGGNLTCRNGCGTVFKLDPATGRFKVLHAFAGGTDGTNPYAALTSDGSGNLVGTTNYGGANGDGTVFRISKR